MLGINLTSSKNHKKATCYRKKLIIQHKKIDNPLYVTVSVNEEFVEGGTFDKAVLKDGDSVEFLYFMGGGC